MEACYLPLAPDAPPREEDELAARAVNEVVPVGEPVLQPDASGSAALVASVLGSLAETPQEEHRPYQRRKTCIVSGCPRGAGDRDYSPRYRLCVEHQRASQVLVRGILTRFCHKCSKLEPLAAFEGNKHTCARMLNEHNRRRRERYAEDRQMHAAEQRQYRDRAKARRSAAAAAAERSQMAHPSGELDAEPVAAPLRGGRGGQFPKPRAVWGHGTPDGDDVEQAAASMSLLTAAAAAGAGGAQLRNRRFAYRPQQYHNSPPQPFWPPDAAGQQQLSTPAWFELLRANPAASTLCPPAPAPPPRLPPGYPVSMPGSALVFPPVAPMTATHSLASALPFDTSAFAAALQRTATSNPAVAAVLATAALALLAGAQQPVAPPPPPLPSLPPPPSAPQPAVPHLSADVLAVLLQRLQGTSPASSQDAPAAAAADAAFPLLPAAPDAEAAAMPAALDAEAAAMLALEVGRFPSSSSGYVGVRSSGGGDEAAEAVQADGGAGDKHADDASQPFLDGGELSRELSSARCPSATAFAAAAAAARAASGEPPALPAATSTDAPVMLLNAVSSSASVEELVRSVALSGGSGPAADELKHRLRAALRSAGSGSAATNSPAGTGTASGSGAVGPQAS